MYISQVKSRLVLSICIGTVVIIAVLFSFLSPGEPSIKECIVDLAYVDRVKSETAVKVLKKKGSKAIPALIALVGDDTADPRRRMRAARIVGDQDVQLEGVLPAVTSAMKSNWLPLQAAAAYAALRIDPSHQEAGELLILALQSASTDIQALRDLKLLGSNAKLIVPALLKMLVGNELTKRQVSVQALRSLGPAAEEAIPALREMLGDKSAMVRVVAAETLLKIGPPAYVAIPDLLRMLEKNRRAVRRFIAAILGKIKSVDHQEEIVKGLAQVLSASDAQLTANAALSLGEMGEVSRPFSSGIRKLLTADAPIQRRSAVVALVKVDPSGPESILGIIKVLSDESEFVRDEAVRALGQLEPNERKEEIISVLDQAYENNYENVQESIGEFLDRIQS